MYAIILGLILAGPKTEIMLDSLNLGVLSGYEQRILHHQEANYRVLEGSIDSFTTFPLACIGSDPLGREIILFDPHNSPLLEQKYDEFVAHRDFSWEALFHFMHDIFERTDLEKQSGMVPLDAFVAAKVGVCRHVAFAAAYFLDRLAKEGYLPQGKSYYVRDLVKGGVGHAWNLFVLENGTAAWHLDFSWGVIKNILDKEEFNLLRLIYGTEPIRREKKRFNLNTKLL
jgi:hypothetical protein